MKASNGTLSTHRNRLNPCGGIIVCLALCVSACSGGETAPRDELAAEEALLDSEQGGSAIDPEVVDGSDIDDGEQTIGTVAQALSGSFLQTCDDVELSKRGDTFAVAANCRNNANQLVTSSLSGECSSDLANCNGILTCGPC